jgi:hypothetical protein
MLVLYQLTQFPQFIVLVKHMCTLTAKQACSKVMLASAETEAAESSYLYYIQVPLPGSG